MTNICIKYFMFGFNTFILLGGILVFTAGIVGTKESGVLADDAILNGDEQASSSLSIAFIFVGILTVGIAMLGCCGICKDNRYLLFSYVALLVVLMLMMTVTATAKLVESHHLRVIVPHVLELAYLQDRTSFHNNFEAKYKCCGISGAGWYLRKGTALPKECCENTAASCTSLNAFGACVGVVTADAVDTYEIIGVTALIVAVILLLGILLGGYVWYKARESAITGEELVFSYQDFRRTMGWAYGATESSGL